MRLSKRHLSFLFVKNRFAPVSADAMIIQEVINKRVMPDLNIEYATKLNVPMRDCKVEW